MRSRGKGILGSLFGRAQRGRLERAQEPFYDQEIIMGANTVQCPACQAYLNVTAAAAEGRVRILCPQCRTQFQTVDMSAGAGISEPDWAGATSNDALDELPEAAARRSMTPALVIAAIGAVGLVGAAVVGLCLTTARQEPGRGASASPVEEKTETKKLDAEDPRSIMEEEARAAHQRAFIQLMVKGGLARGEKRYADAVKAYEAALALVPDDGEAQAGLVAAKAALAVASAQQDAEAKRHEEAARFMADAREALANKQLAAAVRAYQAALELTPADAKLVQALTDAREQLANDEQEKKKLSEYEDHMAAGRAAMVAQRYADALREFLAAGRIVPGDAAALRGQNDAEKRLGDIRDEQKRKDTYVRLMNQGAAAVRHRHFSEAVAAYRAALKVVPEDARAKRGLKDAQQGLKEAKFQYTQFMNAGTAALQMQNGVAALQAFQQAADLFPNDPAATMALRQAQQIGGNLAAAQVGLASAQLSYNQLMSAATAALYNGRFTDAATNFAAALTLYPGDPQALMGLSEAQAGIVGQVQNAPTYAQVMQQGAAAYQARRYGDAVTAFRQALRLEPNDPQALTGLSQASYALHMANGQGAMAGRRFRDAANEFRAALVAAPGDALALAALRQALVLAR